MIVTAPTYESLADVLHALGDVPPDRILWTPFPGTATEADQVRFVNRDKRLVELIDGVLVEKPMGYRESMLAISLGFYLLQFVRPRNLGIVAGADGIMRMQTGRNRIPDVSFTAWANVPTDDGHLQSVADFGPDIAVEILSEGNTEAEITQKRREYFAAGAQLVWIIDPDTRTVAVYNDVDTFSLLNVNDTLTGGNVLPGFSLSLTEYFNDSQLQPKP